MRKRIVIIVILAALATAAWMWASGRFSRKNDRLLVSGNLELTRVDLAFKVSGRLVELAIREGDWVKNQPQFIAPIEDMVVCAQGEIPRCDMNEICRRGR